MLQGKWREIIELNIWRGGVVEFLCEGNTRHIWLGDLGVDDVSFRPSIGSGILRGDGRWLYR